MITDADIKKMKAVFTTKEDLRAFATKEDLQAMDKKIDDLADTVKNLSNNQRQNTEDLVELITSGFDRTEEAIKRLSEHDEMIDDHERRLDRVEDKIFA